MESNQNATFVQLADSIKANLLRIVSGFLMLSALFSLLLVPMPIASNLGTFYQAVLVIDSLVTGASAVGLWQQKKWGVYAYSGIAIFNQPFLLFMDQWSIGALLIPAGLIALILTKWKTLG